jgi:hypothetical protein
MAPKHKAFMLSRVQIRKSQSIPNPERNFYPCLVCLCVITSGQFKRLSGKT